MSSPRTNQVWAGETISQEAIVVMTGCGGELIVGSMECKIPVEVSLEDWGAFLGLHTQAVFLSYDVADLFWKLYIVLEYANDSEALAELKKLVEEERWIDLRILLNQVHRACLQRKKPLHPMINHLMFSCQPPSIELIHKLVFSHSQLKRTSVYLAMEARPVLPYQDYDKLAKIKKSKLDNSTIAFNDVLPSSLPYTGQSYYLGNSILVKGEIAFKRLHSIYFRIDNKYAMSFSDMAELRFARTCSELNRSEIRNFFMWKNDRIALNEKGFPITDKHEEFEAWLMSKLRKLVDIHMHQPYSPMDSNEKPSMDPEKWGHWIGCDKKLWHWRELYRLADLKRLLLYPKMSVSPHYEMTPLLRSLKPNLQAYRKFKMPIFVPRVGHLFLSGKFSSLGLRCMISDCHLRHFSKRDDRYESVFFDLLCSQTEERAFYTDISMLLYREYAAFITTTASTSNTDEHAVATFKEWITSDDPRFTQWYNIAVLLSKSTILHISNEMRRCFIELEATADELHLPNVDMNILIRLYDKNLLGMFTSPFSRDATFETIISKTGHPAEKAAQLLLNPKHCENPGIAFRNHTTNKRNPLNKLLKRHPKIDPKDITKISSASLAGRLTNYLSSHAQVRTEEVLLTQEDVMLAVAYQLTTNGLRLQGITDDEFVLEVEASDASPQKVQNIRSLVTTVANQILQVVPAICSMTVCDRW